jgi:hypothetical protein
MWAISARAAELFDRALEVLGEAAAAAEPGEGALDEPATREDDEARGALGMSDDLERPSTELRHSHRQPDTS